VIQAPLGAQPTIPGATRQEATAASSLSSCHQQARRRKRPCMIVVRLAPAAGSIAGVTTERI